MSALEDGFLMVVVVMNVTVVVVVLVRIVLMNVAVDYTHRFHEQLS